MTLFIQDPSDQASEFLIDKMLDACNNAIRGAGAFAFLSKGGVRLFLQDTAFVNFANRGTFDLIIGIDAITDTSAIAALNVAIGAAPTLSAKIHIPSHPRSIFHPKLAWFQTPDGGILITGSGNLTAGGLRWNIEAFNITSLTTEEVNTLAAQWQAFKDRCTANLFPTDDPQVVTLLERNAFMRRRPIVPRVISGEGADTAQAQEVEVISILQIDQPSDVDVVPPVTNTSEVLVAEIPQSGSRWKQANFDQHTFINFFGASTTVARRAYFFHVKPDGSVGHQEVRPAVVVASHNYRFELDAASGIPYPAVGRPIGVFLRVAARTFMYTLLMPGEPAHGYMTNLLNNAVPNPGARMRRVVFQAHQVQQAWPNSTLWGNLSI